MENNWYVITGGPSAGKTSTLALLAQQGYKVVPEAARSVIDEQLAAGRTLDEIRADEAAFQMAILKRKVADEQGLDPSEIIFCDRGVPDTLAYARHLGLAESPELLEQVAASRYKKVFLLEMLPYIKDYARAESAEEAQRIHAHLTVVYEQTSYPLVHVPVMLPEQRVEFILKNL